MACSWKPSVPKCQTANGTFLNPPHWTSAWGALRVSILLGERLTDLAPQKNAARKDSGCRNLSCCHPHLFSTCVTVPGTGHLREKFDSHLRPPQSAAQGRVGIFIFHLGLFPFTWKKSICNSSEREWGWNPCSWWTRASHQKKGYKAVGLMNIKYTEVKLQQYLGSPPGK